MVIITWPFVILTKFYFSIEFCGFYVLHYTRKSSKKFIQNEMIMFCHKYMSLRDFDNFLRYKTVLFPRLIIWFSTFSCLFPDWYIHETLSTCNERLGHWGVQLNEPSWFLLEKKISHIFFIFCFPIDTFMTVFIIWFSKFFYVFPDWYNHETHFACNEELRHRGLNDIYWNHRLFGYRREGYPFFFYVWIYIGFP